MKDNYIDLRKIDNFTHEIQLDKIKLVGLKFKKAESEGRLYAFVSTGEDATSITFMRRNSEGCSWLFSINFSEFKSHYIPAAIVPPDFGCFGSDETNIGDVIVAQFGQISISRVGRSTKIFLHCGFQWKVIPKNSSYE